MHFYPVFVTSTTRTFEFILYVFIVDLIFVGHLTRSSKTLTLSIQHGDTFDNISLGSRQKEVLHYVRVKSAHPIIFTLLLPVISYDEPSPELTGDCPEAAQRPTGEP